MSKNSAVIILQRKNLTPTNRLRSGCRDKAQRYVSIYHYTSIQIAVVLTHASSSRDSECHVSYHYVPSGGPLESPRCKLI